jgi:hypothetical protein
MSSRGYNIRDLIGVTLSDGLGGEQESSLRLSDAAHCDGGVERGGEKKIKKY